MTKEQTIPVATRLTVDEIHAIKMSGESLSEFVKDAIKNKLESESLNFVNKKIQILENDKKMLLLKKREIEKKQKEMKNIPEKEINYLLETKEIIEIQPHFVEGRISKYVNDFQKPYKITKPEFFRLLHEAETQVKEKQIMKGMGVRQ